MKYSILHVIPYFVPAWGYGGPIKIAWDLAKKAVENGNKVSVFTTTAFGERNKVLSSGIENIDGIRVTRFANRNNWLAQQKIWSPVGFQKVLKKEIKSYDFVFLHEYRTILNIIAFQIALENNIPYFLFAYGTLPIGQGWKKWTKIFFDRFWGKQILQNATGVFAQTSNEKKEYKHFGIANDKIHSFPLMIDLKEFQHLPTKNVARKKFHLKEEDFVITFLGRLHSYKGINLLIEAIEQLKTRISSLKLLIVGRDEGYLPTIRKKIKEKRLKKNIRVSPPLYEKDRLLAYTAADVFVLTPNFFEETSLAALEALASGVPVIVSKQAEIPYLSDFHCGSVIDYDLSALVEKILYYYNHQAELPTIGKNAKVLIDQKYNLDNLYDQFEKKVKQFI